MKKSISTLLKHSSFSKINRSVNPPVVRASTILFDSMQELVSHEKKNITRQANYTLFIWQIRESNNYRAAKDR